MNERTSVPRRRSPVRIFALAALALLTTLFASVLAAPGTVQAENSVVSSTPADGSSIATSPATIEITFTEPLGEVNTIAVQCDAELYPVGPREVSDDRLTLSAPLVDPVPASDCVVSWAVSDADDQPNGAGNITFSVENDTAPAETTPTTEVAPDTTDAAGTTAGTGAGTSDEVAELSSVETGQGPLWLGRLISSLGIAVLFGSLVLIAVAWPEGVEYLLAVRFVRATWIVAFLGTFLYVAAAAAAVTDSGLGSGFNPLSWVDLFDAGLPGIAAVARILFVLASAWVAFRPDRVIDPVTQLAALLIPAAATAMIGLSRTDTDLAFVYVPVSIVHALAMAVWLGGVVLLARVVLAGPGEEDLVHAVRGFGRLSTAAIVLAVATGVVQMVLIDGGSLFTSSHGRVVLLKTVVVAFMVFVGLSARQFVTAKLARADELTIPTADRLRRAFGVEAAAGLVVLALSAWLVSLAPPNISTAETVDFAIELRVESAEADLDVTVGFTNDTVGLSGMWVEVDAPESDLSGLEIVLTAPPNDTVGTITQPVPLSGPGIGVVPPEAGIPFEVAGDWTLTVNAVTANGVFNSDPQLFTIRNPDGSVPTTALTIPPRVTVPVDTTPDDG
ncbi:MAG TPA: CopD family protein [Ilumatobacteraceae bacterium]|nr:CopD family protein [Ilumatobacteraceae bacterium]